MKVITEALRNQFDSCVKMTETLIDICPDSIWVSDESGTPFWHRVYHYVFFIDYWMRDQYGDGDYRSMALDQRLTPDMGAELPEDLLMTREEMREYLAAICVKTRRVFDRLDDAVLTQSVLDGNPQYTYADVITGQIRHIMYNLGSLNGILRRNGLPESDWYAYNEEEGA